MKILIVEDDDNLRSGLEDLLDLEGFNVISAHNIAIGFDRYNQEKPDFCIFDIMLDKPDDGFTLCKKIRENDALTPILMLSARAEEIDRVLGFECGADDYLLKPFGPRELVARIKAITKRVTQSHPSDTTNKPPTNSNACFTMHALTINPTALRAFRDDTAIELTERDVRILTLLHTHAGQVLNRDKVFDECWGRTFMPNSRALDQYISSLRKKIDPHTDKENSIISTVHGVGYRYDPTTTTNTT